MVRHKTEPKKLVTPTNKPSPEKAAKKKRWRPGTVALREIKSLQRSTDLLIPKLPMARLIKEQSQQTAINRIKWKKEAINALHTATEDELANIIWYILTHHSYWQHALQDFLIQHYVASKPAPTFAARKSAYISHDYATTRTSSS